MRGIIGVAIAMALLGSGCQHGPAEPSEIVVLIGPTGKIDWNGERVSLEEFEMRVLEVAARDPKPHISTRTHPDSGMDGFDAEGMQALAHVMNLIMQHGLGKIGFITRPPQ